MHCIERPPPPPPSSSSPQLLPHPCNIPNCDIWITLIALICGVTVYLTDQRSFNKK